MIKRVTSCVWPALPVAAACKEVCFRQNCSSVLSPAYREGLDHDQVQALGHIIPPAHGCSLHACRARHRRAWGAHSSCKLTEHRAWEGHQV